MRRRIFLFLAICTVFLLFSPILQAQSNYLRADESATRIFLREKTAQVLLIIENTFNNGDDKTKAKIKIELVSPNDETKDFAERDVDLEKGRNKIDFAMANVAEILKENFAFYRLRYAINYENQNINGIIAVSEIAPEMFEIEAIAAENVRENQRYFVRTKALQPISLSGVENVQISGELGIEFENKKDPITVRAVGVTDAQGYALLEFNLPPDIKKVDETSLKIIGSKNDLTREAEKNDVSFFESQFAYLQTDKPIYQPAQSLKARTLFLNAANRALPAQDLVFVIKDPDDQILQRIAARTSRFGVASAEWQIPENAKLGAYRLRVEDGIGGQYYNEQNFKVSRYELPNFTVNAKASAPFYLPEQKTAEVEVSADYLFGQPVTKAKVRIVREESREWNYKEQKYETKEGESHEGEFGENGKFTANFDLTKLHEDLADSGGQQFEDVTLAAYVTDLTTNRTEQRRFDVRVTKQPIHVYLIGKNYRATSRLLPAKYYVSTFYADGTPAICDVEIYLKKDEDINDKPMLGKRLARAKTNSLGAGRIVLPFNAIDKDEDYPDIVVKARDANGKIGLQEDDLDLSHEAAIQVETDKNIYRAGEPVKVSIRSNAANATLFVDILHNDQIVRAERINLVNGRAELNLSYQKEFEHNVTIAAYAKLPDEDGDLKLSVGSKSVAYPKPHGLQIKTETASNVYRPGENATMKFTAVRADGGAEESALGVVVLDKAIEERARADSEFGGGYRSFYADFEGLMGFRRGFGGITGYEVDNLDLSKPISPDADLAIEIALQNGNYYRPDFFRSRNFQYEYEQTFKSVMQQQLEPVKNALDEVFAQSGKSPNDEASVRTFLTAKNINFDVLRDSWGNKYRVFSNVSRDKREIYFQSAGADKIYDTKDDLTVLALYFNYFQPLGLKINRALREYHERTDDFIRDYKTLREELLSQNINLNDLRDAWGKKYRFEFTIDKSDFLLRVTSGGANKKFGTATAKDYDDFSVWENRSDYFEVMRSAMNKAFTKYVRENGRLPNDENEFNEVLKETGFDLAVLKDIFGRQFYVSKEASSRYADKIQIRARVEAKTDIKPVTQQIVTYFVKSAGADSIKGNADDFELVRFIGIISEKSKDDKESKLTVQPVPASSKYRGAIQGTVTDANGAVISGVSIAAARFLVPNSSIKLQTFTKTTDAEGFFAFDDLIAGGIYELTFDATGFKRLIMQGVAVQNESVTEINVTLEVGSVSEAVSISSESVTVEVSSSSVATAIDQRQIEDLPLNGRSLSSLLLLKPGFVNAVTKSGVSDGKNQTEQQIETPRLREYFPETLVWQPELITDANGKATLNFKLADSLTTWKMAVIGSTVDGEIGVAEKEFKTFQPFFAEHDPPKILTAGDRIALPVVLRNYLDKPQKVSATMKEENWFKLSGSASQTLEVAANSAQSAIFNFAAVAAVKDGKQRVTTIGTDSSDAIEKTVSVHPNGREMSVTQGKVFRDLAIFDINFPADALPNTQRAEVKIYPNLMSHVVEAIEGLLHRPYGCGEQTISSTYPSLLILKAAKNGADSALENRARKYLQLGYDRLLGYKAAGGGFNYWGRGAADLALSAYALRFLLDAREFIAVDENLINETRDFLLKEQTADGSWRNNVTITTYAARILARNADDEKSKAALQKALKFLQTESAKINEPYVLAQYALALFDARDKDAALAIAEKLKTLAKTEGDGIYWNLETNTPFYGWGIAGRTETTALVLQVLAKVEEISRKDAKAQSDDQISKGLQFLLKNKDRYGVWYSTQTTINVLDAMIELLPKGESAEHQGNAEIFVNGQKAQEISISNKLNNPTTLDLTEFLTQPNNRVEIRQNGANRAVSAQIVQNYYQSWKQENGFRTNDSDALRLKVDFDKTTAKIGEEIICRVATERIGFRGYGMLLAEIGLPPGADVSRESLEKAVADSDWNLSSYDILPDKVIVYLWTKAGGNKFEFKFKSRYSIEANTAPSQIYDYYNPESNAVLAPTKFVVK